MEGYGYSVRRDGKRWIVLKGWHILASFETREECNQWIEWHKEEVKRA